MIKICVQVKENQQVKLVFSEQLSKLQNKQNQDMELLEEIRSFSKQRAAIEKEYGQALQRLAVQYQKRDWQRGNTDAITSGSVFGVWRSVVDVTAQCAATRLNAAEEYHKLIGRASRSLHDAKDIQTKRGLDRLQRIHSEVVDALQELHQVRKRYHQLSHITNVAREKAAGAHTRAQKTEHRIFHFKMGVHKMEAKLSARLKACEDQLTEVRNEYLLMLAAVNAHQQHYHRYDLPLIMEQLNRDIYRDLRHYFTLLCGTEMDACLASHKQYNKIRDSVAKMTRERNIEQFLQESSSFNKSPDFTFQPAPRDKVSALQDICLIEGESCLVKEAKKWATKAAKDYKIVTHGERALQMLESRLKLLSGETGLSVEQKMAEVQESIRKAKLSGVKAEARLALLSESISGPERWFEIAMRQAEEELERERHLSEQRKSTEDFSEDEFELTDFEVYDDENGDIFADLVSASGVCVYPAACRVIFSYQASKSDELSITEGEELQLIEDGNMEDWQKVCNSCGQVGYVPECPVQFPCLQAEDPSQPDDSISSTLSLAKEKVEHRGVVRALYSYQAQSAEELSFQEGALIHLIRCQQGEVDDGFWEGELNGRIGVFPSSMVEFFYDDEEKEEREEPTPPASSPTPIPSPSRGSSTSSGGVEEKQQSVLQEESMLGEASQNPLELPPGRIRPCRAPPPPPKQKPSAQQ
ncbi:F-BAR and double SH3 domains protein 1-like [Melanotaenia boesemani]|uniref:F-BAR and double SH3 domains protein 1-like n=1 Tax=Melanotaenia boesemani TaxID=1250792 RepID=UPI001C0460EF|nr:F-BAR and double SH3 domains protein 1-like [Melanotaenia boesemani]